MSFFVGNREHFPGIGTIAFEGRESKNPLSFTFSMPARARNETIRRDDVGYYHRFNRCVRRAFLCGMDPLTGNDYGHRKAWILDWTGSQLRSGRPGAIPADSPAILERLKIDASRWPTLVSEFSRLFRSAAGRLESLAREAQRTGRHWLRGFRQAANAFG